MLDGYGTAAMGVTGSRVGAVGVYVGGPARSYCVDAGHGSGLRRLSVDNSANGLHRVRTCGGGFQSRASLMTSGLKRGMLVS